MKVPEYMRETLQRLKRGPSINAIPGTILTEDEVRKSYQRWYTTWIEPDLIRLFPEIKQRNKNNII